MNAALPWNLMRETPHPANQLLAGLALVQSTQAQAVQLAEYRGLLASMDWQYEFSDDHRAIVAGREQIRRIRALQPYVDTDRALFNAARPDSHGSATL